MPRRSKRHSKQSARWYQSARTRSNAAARRRKAKEAVKTPQKNEPLPPTVSSQFLASVIAWFKGPIGSQILAIALILLGMLSIVTIAGFNSGKLINSWAKLLVKLLGWGAYPVSAFISSLGMLWLRHLVHQRSSWRWRPFIGFTLALLALLTLTWTIIPRSWTWVQTGQGGGLIGWSIYQFLVRNIGPLATIVVMGITLFWGLVLAFDITGHELRSYGKHAGDYWNRIQNAWRLANAQVKLAQGRTTPNPRERIVSPAAAPHSTMPERQPVRKTTPVSQPEPKTIPPKPKPAPVVPPLSERPIPALSKTGSQTNTEKPKTTTITAKDEPVLAESSPSRRRGRNSTALDEVPVTLLKTTKMQGMSQQEIEDKIERITVTLEQFGANSKYVMHKTGPTVTQFCFEPGWTGNNGDDELSDVPDESGSQSSRRRGKKVRVSQIMALEDDLALTLAASALRIQAPVPGHKYVGIEVPNSEITTVTLRAVVEDDAFQKNNDPLRVAVGLDVAGTAQVMDLAKMPHLLIAGTTGSGKSVFVKSLATSLVMSNSPDTLRLIMIDPKLVELSQFNGLPHLLGPTQTDLEEIIRVLRWVAHEMDRRYELFAKTLSRNLDDYNTKITRKHKPGDEEEPETLPYIVVIVDELADLMMAAPDETEKLLARIAQMARATGIHMVVATQRPSTDVITGLIKANFPARISFATASSIDSRVILDSPGAQTLLGRGDMLFMAPDASAPVRVQGCYISEQEIGAVIDFWQREAGATPAKGPWEVIAEKKGPENLRLEGYGDDADLLEQAIAIAHKRGNISTSGLQRALRVSYPRARRLMEEMETMGIVGPQEAAGRKRRVILGGDDS